jgi:hypothetical protein
MGWKALKDAFGIEHHIYASEDGVCIGSGYIPNIVMISRTTGELEENSAFSSFVREKYPALREASAAELLALIQAPDVFAASIPVYTYKDGEIHEEFCETPGWPNTTHAGNLMYENTYSTDKAKVVAWAKRSAMLETHYLNEDIIRREAALVEARTRLATAETYRAKLDEDYPDIKKAE